MKKKLFFFLTLIFVVWLVAGFVRTCHAQNFDFPDTVNGWHWWSWGGPDIIKVWTHIVDDGTAIEGKMCQAFGYELEEYDPLNWFEWKKDLGFSFSPAEVIELQLYINDFTLAPGVEQGSVRITLRAGSDTAWYFIINDVGLGTNFAREWWLVGGNYTPKPPSGERINKFRIRFRITGLTRFEVYLDELASWSPTSYDLLDRFGDSMIVGVPRESPIPNETRLFQNYPNPFNPRTVISFQVTEQAPVSLKVYDILGKEIAVLVDEEKPAGEYTINFDGGNLPSGVYFYTLRAGRYVQTRKMVLVK